ncbi:MAG: DUF4783 domain-containing protein [Bacteroidetes bacterium]|nr:DUF4783 domain-containing protein [Bacteroidota bacterium]
MHKQYALKRKRTRFLFDTTIEIKINDKEGAYSKAQAEQVVKDFL